MSIDQQLKISSTFLKGTCTADRKINEWDKENAKQIFYDYRFFIGVILESEEE